MSGLARALGWAAAALVLLLARRLRRRPEPAQLAPPPAEDASPAPPEHLPDPRAELWVAGLLGLAALLAAGFVVVDVLDPRHATQLMGLCLGLCLAALAAAAVLAGKRLVAQETAVEERPQLEHPEEQERVADLIEQPRRGISRRRLLKAAAGAAGAAVGGALIVPLASLGPVADQQELLKEDPWRSGTRLIDLEGRALAAAAVPLGGFVSAFPEGADPESLGSPLVVLRIAVDQLRLPPERAGWAPEGIMAFSKICTHAGCAIELFRYPLYAPTSPGPALVCPCHYSTFDVRTGGERTFGPAARPLPQLPLQIDGDGHLRAGGPLSAPPGPSWWGVRL
ncbi:MAG: ubiquinol-cytochrome c reductase iron-sulfur subunit [Miltoncostaeaceae bacterium]|nr:ubiquinol-cytochrome c reductase iron-sulfur subunit [Miltoncostaeaceae bacterium]